MIDLARTKERMLAEIGASATSERVVLRGHTAAELVPLVDDVLSRRLAHVPAKHLFTHLRYLVRKGVGNAYKWGNGRDAGRSIVVEAAITDAGAVVSISNEGDGFDVAGVLARFRRGERFFTHGGSGFKNFDRTRSVISYADGGRTLLIRFLCRADATASGAGDSGGSDMNDRKKQKVSIVSYPKSGRTWLRVLIGKALCDRDGLDEQLIFDKHGLADATGLHISYTHEDAGISRRTPFAQLDPDKSSFHKRKVVLLVREPRDILVSSYCHLSKRTRTDAFAGPISEFIRSDRYGIEKILTYYNIWNASLATLPATFLLRYEEMHADPRGRLRAILDFLGVEGIPDAGIERAVEYASFGNMKKLEEKRYFDSRKMKPGQAEDEESYKVRRGVVGGYGEYLGPDDIRYIEDVVRARGCAFYPALARLAS
jgi:hypothetical protein